MARKLAGSGGTRSTGSPVKRAATEDSEDEQEQKPFKRSRRVNGHGHGHGNGTNGASGDGVAGSSRAQGPDSVLATQYADDGDGASDGEMRDVKAHAVKSEEVRAKIEAKGDPRSGSGSESEYDEEDDGEGGKARKKRRKAKAQEYERDRDGYVKGSIMRVRLENFVTYDYVDFRPGPHLNMIIGPNGTGKSTIVCGIVLGLGGTPRMLGRQPELYKFVKQEKEKGWTEVTLKDGAGKAPIVIRRLINRSDKKSVWEINGVVATMQAVIDVTNRLNIQVGNLCSFLPQDKVAEFAQMAPTTLLSETIKAAGHHKLSEWHVTLVNTGRDFRKLDADLENETELLERMRGQQRELEPQVNQLHERRNMRSEITFLQHMIPFAEAFDLKAEFEKKKAEKAAAKKAVRDENHRHVPLEQLRKKLATHVKQAMNAGGEADKALLGNMAKAARLLKEYDEEGTRFEEVREKLKTVKLTERKKKEKIVAVKAQIGKLQEITESGPAEVDTQPYRDEISKISEQVKAARNGLDRANQAVQDVRSQSRQVNDTIQEKRSQLRMLQDIRTKREQALARVDPSCGYAMEFYKNNRDKFEQEIFFPPFVSLEVKDKAYASIVEACIPNDLMKTFVCQTRSDYELLSGLNDGGRHKYTVSGRQGNVRINTSHVNAEELELLDQPRSLSNQQLHAMGLGGYVVDLCDAPKPVLAYASKRGNLSTTAFRIDGGAEQNIRPLDGRQVDNSSVRSYIVWDARRQAGSRTTTIVSQYGNRGKQSSTYQINTARVLSESIDQTKVESLNNDLADLQTRHRSFEGHITKANQESSKQQDSLAKAQDAMNKAKAALNAANSARNRYLKAKADLEIAEQTLAGLERGPTALERRQAITAELMEIARGRGAILLRHQKLSKHGTDLQHASIVAGLTYLQAKANDTAVHEQYSQRDERAGRLALIYNELSEKVKTLVSRYEAIHVANARRHQELLQKIADDDSEEAATAFAARIREASHADPRKSANEFKQELEETKQSLRLLPNLDEGIIERLQELTKQIQEREKIVKDGANAHRKLKKRIDTTLVNFNENLDSLVGTVSAKFSAAFERIGCSGEVHVRRHADDYAQWAIEILVKFRDEEEMQVLTAQRQSGGERSMTTIMYLMSLTELARTPFSLVDEINQGMDQRAERAVHDQLVETTCRADAGQYFLITPKLLTGLKYHPMMKVLCINNGEYLPDKAAHPHIGDLSAFLRARRRRLARGGRS